MTGLILASSSDVRGKLLSNAGVEFDVIRARVDESAIKEALLSEGASSRDIADTLAETKAKKVSQKNPSCLVLGCDQVLEHDGRILSKPETPNDAIEQISQLNGSTHQLLSAVVLYQNDQPIWRFIGKVRLTMRPLSPAFIAAYVERNWESIQHCVGCYQLEHEGVRLFSRVEGDFFHVLGLPLIEVLNHLTLIGAIEG